MPGSAAAWLTSIRTIFAWRCGLRSSLPTSVRGNWISSAYTVCPVAFAWASILASLPPTTAVPQSGGLFTISCDRHHAALRIRAAASSTASMIAR